MAAASVQSLSTLLQRASIEDHEEVLKACNAALKKSKNDIHAQHVKAVALLKLDRYDDSLRVLEEGGDALKKRASLEYAYALYKCGKWSEAADIAARLGSGRGAKHVEAQAVGLLHTSYCTSPDLFLTEFHLMHRATALRNLPMLQKYTRIFPMKTRH